MDYTIWVARSEDGGSCAIFDSPPDKETVKNEGKFRHMNWPISVVRVQCVTVSEKELFTIERSDEMDSERFAELLEEAYNTPDGDTLVLHLSRFLDASQRERFLDFIGMES